MKNRKLIQQKIIALKTDISKLQKKYLIMISIGIILTLGCIMYWFYSQRYVSTEDAYINANVVQIAPRVNGQVTHLYVANNQFIEKGQKLFDVDAEPYKVMVEKAEAQFEIDQVNLLNVQLTHKRTMELVNKNVLSRQTGDDVTAKLKSATAAVKLSQANLKDARLKLEYTSVLAPTSGWVTNMSMREGNIIEVGQPVFAIISNAEFWVDANFKETELVDIKKNQQASIKVDMYAGQTFDGVVDSISGGSGVAFSLMPPQNATGNWVKVTQRIPVRIRIMNANLKFPLRIGASAKTTIDLHSSSKA